MCEELFPRNRCERDWNLPPNTESALRDMIGGAFESLFMPKSASHRMRDSNEFCMLKDLVAAGVIVLVARDVPAKTAAKEMAALLSRRNLRRSDGKSITAATVYEWWKPRRTNDKQGRLATVARTCSSWIDAMLQVETGRPVSQATAATAIRQVLDAFVTKDPACPRGSAYSPVPHFEDL